MPKISPLFKERDTSKQMSRLSCMRDDFMQIKSCQNRLMYISGGSYLRRTSHLTLHLYFLLSEHFLPIIVKSCDDDVLKFHLCKVVGSL